MVVILIRYFPGLDKLNTWNLSRFFLLLRSDEANQCTKNREKRFFFLGNWFSSFLIREKKLKKRRKKGKKGSTSSLNVSRKLVKPETNSGKSKKGIEFFKLNEWLNSITFLLFGDGGEKTEGAVSFFFFK